MNQTHYGWAIKLPKHPPLTTYDAWAGIYYFGGAPAHMLAIRTAVFQTRKAAREANKERKIGGQVTRVRVTVEST